MFLYKRKGIYYIHYFDESENRARRISTKSRIKPEALRFLSNFKNELQEKQRLRFVTLNQFCVEYLNYVSLTLSKGYYRSIDFSFKLLKEKIGSDYPLRKISSFHLESFLLDRFSQAKYGTSLIYRTLKSAFNKAIEWNYLNDNPLVRIKLPKVPQKHPAYITESELQKIISNEPKKDFQDIYIFAFHTGCRINEILNMKWGGIDFENKIIDVKNNNTFTTKSKRDRVIPINETLINMLKKRVPLIQSIDRSNLVFEKMSGIIYRSDTVSKCFKKAVKRAKLEEGIHIHSLRHSFASNLVKNNVSLYVVKELLGHKDIQTTQIYSHLTIDSLRTAVKFLEN